MKTCYARFALYKHNLNTYIMPHAVIKSRYINVTNHSEISRYFSVHVLPYPLRNSKELTKFYHFKLPWRLPGQTGPNKLHLLSTVLLSGLQGSREVWYPLSKAVLGKFRGSDMHIKCSNCLQEWANFPRSLASQMVLIFNTAMASGYIIISVIIMTS